jgi:hypothetical protein
MIRQIRVTGPDGCNNLDLLDSSIIKSQLCSYWSHASSAIRTLDAEPEHGQNCPRSDAKVAKVSSIAGANGNWERNV